jgi:hypothetical protein
VLDQPTVGHLLQQSVQTPLVADLSRATKTTNTDLLANVLVQLDLVIVGKKRERGEVISMRA